MSAALDVHLDVTQAAALLAFGAKRLEYAVVNTVNNLAHRVQDEIRAELPIHGFIIRKEFVRRQVALIESFANVAAGRHSVRVEVGQRARLLLPEFETGGIRRPFTPGATHVAVPILGRPARPSLRAGVPPAYTFAGLKFKAYHKGRILKRRRRGRTSSVGLLGEYGRLALPESNAGGTIYWKGQQRTYIVPGVGVFQRIGPSLRDTRLIWAFSRPYPLHAMLKFVSTARRIVDSYGHLELQKQVQAVLDFHGIPSFRR